MKQISMWIAVVLALLLGGCATTRDRDAPAPWATSAPEFVRLKNGMTVRYVSSGDGPSLVLLHTIRTQLEYFEKLVPELKGRYRVYALDLPGHGQSSLLTEDYTELLLRQAVSEFVTQLDLRSATLVGESFGGGIRRSGSGWMVGMFNIFGSNTSEPRLVTAAVLRGGFHRAARLPDAFSTSSPEWATATATAASSTPTSRTGPSGSMPTSPTRT